MLHNANTSDTNVGGVVASQYMVVKLTHLKNAFFPIEETFSPIFTVVKLSHQENASGPIVVTLLGMAILVKPSQVLYLQPVITQYFASNKSEIWS